MANNKVTIRNTNFKVATPPTVAPSPRVQPVPIYEVNSSGGIDAKLIDKADLRKKMG